MNDPYQKELSALFSSDSDALVDEAFVRRCVTLIRHGQRRVLALKLIISCAAAGVVRLVSPSLLDPAAIVPSSLSAAFAALDSAIGRAIVVGIFLVLIVRRYGLPSFRLRQTRP